MDQLVAQCAELFRCVQGVDNNARRQAEEALANLRKSRPDQLVQASLQIIQADNFDPQARQMAAVLLRRHLGRGHEAVWNQLQRATQEHVKAQLLVCLQHVRDLSVQKHLCHTVSSLAGTVLDQDINQWNDVLQFLVKWTKSPDDKQRAAAMNIFSQLLQNLESKLKQFYPNLIAIFSEGLGDSSVEVRLAALSGAATFVVVSPKDMKPFQDRINVMLETVSGCISSGSDDNACAVLSLLIEPLAECVPNFFENHIEGMCQAMVSIASKADISDTVRHLAVEFIVTISEAKPRFIAQQPALLSKHVPVLLSMMVQIQENAQWNEGEAFDEDDREVDVASESLDRMALSLGGEQLVPVLFNSIAVMFADSNWKSRHAALMAISVVGEGCAQVLTPNLDRVMNSIMQMWQDPHPRVRWAFCNTVGQMATDFRSLFQERYHEPVVQALTGLMDDQANQRVQAHAAAAVVNFCDHCTPNLLEPYLNSLLSKLYELLSQQKVLVLEQAITAVASVADSAKSLFIPFYAKFIPFFKSVLLSATTKEYRYLRGKAMEAISLIAVAVGKDVFLPDAKEVLDTMMQVHMSDLAADDPLLTFLPQAWARLCKALGATFVPYLPQILPPLIALASQKPDVKLFEPDDAATQDMDEDKWELIRLGDRTIVVNTVTVQEKSSAVNMLYCYAEELKADFFPYVGDVAPLCLKLVRFYFNDEIRSSAASLIPALLNATKLHVERLPTPGTFVKDLFHFTYSELLKSIAMEMDSTVLLAKLDALQESIDIAGPDCLDPEKMHELCETMRSTINFCSERRKVLDSHTRREDFEADDQASVAAMQRMQQDVVLAVEEVLGKALKHNPVTFLPMYKEMFALFTPLLAPGGDPRDKAACLYAFDDLVEYGGPAAIPLYQGMIPQVLSFVNREADVHLRQAATYGVGVLAQCSGDAFASLLPGVLDLLHQLVTAPDSRAVGNINSTENSISALGKIMQFQSKHVDVNALLPVWISYLPVNGDATECKVIYAQLCTFIMHFPDLVMGENYCNLPKLLSIFASVFGTELVNDEVTGAMGSILKRMTLTFPPELMERASSSLSDAHRMKLQDCVAKANADNSA